MRQTLEMNLKAFLKSLKVLVLAIDAYGHALHTRGLAPNAPERLVLRTVADGLIGLVAGSKAKVRTNLWGKSGERDIQVDQALLSRLIRDGAVDADAATQVQEAESVLALQTNSWALVQKAAAMRKCWGSIASSLDPEPLL